MRDEEYQAEQIPAYGAHEQPAIAARTGRHLRVVQFGTLAGLAAVLLAGIALLLYPDINGRYEGRGWAVTLTVCAVAMLVICVVQLRSWVRALAVWRDRPTSSPGRLLQVSWVAHLVSYAVVLVAIWATIVGVIEAGWTATSSVLMLLTLLALVAAQTLAGVQYVRAAGPPGTLPAHMRRLVARENRPISSS